MAQVTLYLDAETAARMKEAAKSEGLSQSQWLARVVRERLSDAWPESVKALAGAWPDFPSLEEIRAAKGEDSPRESLG